MGALCSCCEPQSYCSDEADVVEAAQHLYLLRGVTRLLSRRVQHPLTRFWRHGSHLAQSATHHLLALRLHGTELSEQCLCPLLLFGSKVLDHLHAIQHSLLLLGRQGVECLEPVSELLLALRRKLAEVLILFEFLLPFLGRKLHGVAQPVAVVRALSAKDLTGRRLRSHGLGCGSRCGA